MQINYNEKVVKSQGVGGYVQQAHILWSSFRSPHRSIRGMGLLLKKGIWVTH